MQGHKGFTTMIDMEQFTQTRWAFLANVKMKWQYDGMAYLFRKGDIPIYGVDRGTMKMNHPIMCAIIPAHRDKNYGVDIYVPVSTKQKAQRLIADEEQLRLAAEREVLEGPDAYARFEEEALSARDFNEKALSRYRKEKWRNRLGAMGDALGLSKKADSA